MTQESPIQFRLLTNECEASPPPVLAQKSIRDEHFHPAIRGAVETDPRVSELLNTGWCFYPPQTIQVTPNKTPPVTPPDALDSTDTDTESTNGLLKVNIATSWSITVTEDTPVLIVPWTGTLDDHIATQLVTADDGTVPVHAPIATQDPITIDEDRPLLQVIPLPDALLEAEWETGTPPDEYDIEGR